MRRGSGIGRALAEAVLQAGHRLVATARDPKQLEDLSNRFGKSVCVTPECLHRLPRRLEHELLPAINVECRSGHCRVGHGAPAVTMM